MGKRKNRQPDIISSTIATNDVHSSGSSEGEASPESTRCPHIAKAITTKSQLLKPYRKNFEECQIEDSFMPSRLYCPMCKKKSLNNDDQSSEEKFESPMMWACLWCGNIACGKTWHSHAEEHFKKPHSDSHCLSVNIHNWSVWCYECDHEVNVKSTRRLQDIIESLKSISTSPKVLSSTKLKPLTPPAIVVDSEENQNELSNYTKVVGLTNLGNTCFFNSVLQCLAQTPYLVKVLEELREPGDEFCLPGGKFKISGEDDGENEGEIFPPIRGTLKECDRLTSCLYDTLTAMQNSPIKKYDPSILLNEFRNTSVRCIDGGQHDAHELLRNLLELVRNEDLKRYQAIILQELGLGVKQKRQNLDANQLARLKFYGNQASARLLGPEPVFRGQLVSTLVCMECNHSSSRIEPFLDLSLPVMADKPQPPALKRKNSGVKENDTINDNVFTKNSQPSKHQMKKEKKAARKNRKYRRQRDNQFINNDDSLSLENNISELNDENSATNDDGAHSEGEEESDADVEDNIEGETAPISEVIESGYSSEKTSHPSPIELEAISPLNNSTAKPTTFSEAETDECRSSPETEHANTESTIQSNTLNGVAEITTELINLNVSKPKTLTRYKTEEGECSIQSCLNQFTAVELLSGSNAVGCEACTAQAAKKNGEDVKSTKMVCTPSSKQYLISRVPPVLILHLKRFQSMRFRAFRKVNDHVKFPLLLDLAPVCKNHKKPKLYSLYGLVEHSGNLYGGHYVAYVKSRKPLEADDPRWSFLPKKGTIEDAETKCYGDSDDEGNQESSVPEPPPGQWYYVSDTCVMKIDETSVLQKEAYLLFYERIL